MVSHPPISLEILERKLTTWPLEFDSLFQFPHLFQDDKRC